MTRGEETHHPVPIQVHVDVAAALGGCRVSIGETLTVFKARLWCEPKPESAAHLRCPREVAWMDIFAEIADERCGLADLLSELSAH